MHLNLPNSLSPVESGFNIIESRIAMHYRRGRSLHCPQGQLGQMWLWSLDGIGLQRHIYAVVWGKLTHCCLLCTCPDHLQR